MPVEQGGKGILYLCGACLSPTTETSPVDPANDETPGKDESGNEDENNKNNANTKGTSGKKDVTNPANTPTRNRTFDRSLTICKFFRTNRCKHGNNGHGCKFYHPPVCRKYREWGTDEQRGCSKEKDCKYFHVKICKSSGPDRKCKKAKCNLVHVKSRKKNSTPHSEKHTPPAKTNQVRDQGPRVQQNFLTLLEQLTTATMAALSPLPKQEDRIGKSQTHSCCAQKKAATINNCLNSCC